MDYDRVIVMDKGRVAESGHPFELLTLASSHHPKNEGPPRRSLLSKSQAPLAIPEHFPFEPTSGIRLEEPNETLVLNRERARTYSNRSDQANEPESVGIFKTLVEQTGSETAAMLYQMAEESYKKMLEKKNS